MSHGPIYLWQLIYQAKTDVVNRGAPETVSVDRWLLPLSLPTPPQPGLHVSQQQFQPYEETARFPEVVSEDRWHQPWSDPPKPKAGLAASAQQALALTEAAPFPETVTESRWHQPWSEPVRQKIGISATEHPLVSFDPFPFVSFSWFNALSEPVRRALRLVAGANPDEFFSESARFPEIVSEDRWHQPWSEPVRRATNAALQSTTAFTPVVTTTASVDGWGTPLSEPQRQFLGLPAREQQFLAWDPAVFVASVAGWATAIADVPKPKAGLPASEQQALAYVEAAPFPEAVSEDRWHQPWSDPVRTKPALPAGEQQALAFVSVTTAAAPPIDGWGSPLSEPTRRTGFPPHYSKGKSFFGTAPEAVSEDRWHQPWSEPVRTKPGLPASQQQSLAYGNFTPVQAQVQWWGQQWADPVQYLAKWTTAETPVQFVAIQNQVVESEWHSPWLEPVRAKPGTTAALQQTLAFVPFTATTPSIDGWGQPWVDPPKAKVSVNVAAQQALAQSPNFTVTAPPLDYFLALSEPQRQLAGLAARFQQNAAYGFVPIVPPFIFFFGNEEPLPWPGFRANQFIRENYDSAVLPPFPIPNPPQTQGKFTVSGPSVSDLFPVSGVVYPYAPETRKTVP